MKVQEEVRDNISTSKWLKSEKPSIFNPHWLRHRLTFAFAQRLLHAANAEDRAVRVRAIKRLGEIKSLDTWHYSILARMCDAKAAVGLARHREIDLRFFVEPPMGFVTYNHEKFVGMVKEFLVALHEKSKHVCMGYFIGEAFEDVHVSVCYIMLFETDFIFVFFYCMLSRSLSVCSGIGKICGSRHSCSNEFIKIY